MAGLRFKVATDLDSMGSLIDYGLAQVDTKSISLGATRRAYRVSEGTGKDIRPCNRIFFKLKQQISCRTFSVPPSDQFSHSSLLLPLLLLVSRNSFRSFRSVLRYCTVVLEVVKKYLKEVRAREESFF